MSIKLTPNCRLWPAQRSPHTRHLIFQFTKTWQCPRRGSLIFTQAPRDSQNPFNSSNSSPLSKRRSRGRISPAFPENYQKNKQNSWGPKPLVVQSLSPEAPATAQHRAAPGSSLLGKKPCRRAPVGDLMNIHTTRKREAASLLGPERGPLPGARHTLTPSPFLSSAEELVADISKLTTSVGNSAYFKDLWNAIETFSIKREKIILGWTVNLRW